MKATILDTLKLLRRIEKDEPDNVTKMQLVVWSSANGTELMVRAYKPTTKDAEHLWDNKRSLAQVDAMVLRYMEKLRLIKNASNWDYYIDVAKKIQGIHVAEDPKLYAYFGWRVKDELLQF